VRFSEFAVRAATDADLAAVRATLSYGTGTLPFVDTFDDAAGGWATRSWEKAGSEYRDGEYAIQLGTAGMLSRTWAPLVEVCPREFVVEATGYKLSGGDDAEYGIVWGVDGDSCYYFLVSADGSYKVMYRRKGDWQSDPIPWTEDRAIERGSAANRLRVVVVGEEATLVVNDQRLATIDLELEGPYRVGLAGQSYQSAPIEVRFSEFAVRAATDADLAGD
jgi:hypothetical protein